MIEIAFIAATCIALAALMTRVAELAAFREAERQWNENIILND